MKGNFVYQRLGKNVSEHRQILHWSQEELAARAAIDRSYIGRIEVGHANPSFKILYKLSRTLHIKLSDLLQGV